MGISGAAHMSHMSLWRRRSARSPLVRSKQLGGFLVLRKQYWLHHYGLDRTEACSLELHKSSD